MAVPGLPQRLTLAVLTFRRPGDIEALLPQLVQQAAEAASPALQVRILVIDNDPQASARATVQRVADSTPEIVIDYVHEPTPGISAARNRAFAASAESDLLFFIDDDERPTPGWLTSMLGAYRTYGAAGTCGPVITIYEVEPSPWIQAGEFFKRRRMPTGSRVDVGGTGNLLLDMHQIRAHGLRFDERFGVSGGEDTLFTRQMRQRGLEIVWCDEAIVHDALPAHRTTRRWVLTRVFRYGTSWSATLLMVSPGAGRRLLIRVRLAAEGGARVVAGLAMWLVGLLTGSARRNARGLKVAARGAGLALGAIGYSYQEYKPSSGAPQQPQPAAV